MFASIQPCSLEVRSLSHFFFAVLLLLRTSNSPSEAAHPYIDGRPQAHLRLAAVDQGVVFRHGGGPQHCDQFGAREAIAFQCDGLIYLYYDGAGPEGWRACLATSSDLKQWQKHGPVLDLGKPGSRDAAAATSPWLIQADDAWHMFYLGTPNASSAPERIPNFPYLTLKARGDDPNGPWTKQYDVIPFTTKDETYYSVTASPGHVMEYQNEYLMYFSASTSDTSVKRTLGIARTSDLDGPWSLDDKPIVPLEEQIENSSIYFEPTTNTWFLFTNHVGINAQKQEFTDAIWVYWTRDPKQWNAKNKAVVLDGDSCIWSHQCLGMPSVVKVDKRLAMFYDAPGADSISHMHRDIALAWLDLPLVAPNSGLQDDASKFRP